MTAEQALSPAANRTATNMPRTRKLLAMKRSIASVAKLFTTLLAALLIASPALAHPGHGGGFAAGFAHPMGGLDHVLAMLAVGLWAALRAQAQDGRAALLAWPAAFIGGMAGGFALTQAGLVVPQVETMIVASVVLLGGAVALGLSAPVLLGAAAIAALGLFHGAAHGMELHGSPLPFASGFILASALLHAAGLGLAQMGAALTARWPIRLAGASIAAAGVALAAGLA
jgi:urease accessory protein